MRALRYFSGHASQQSSVEVGFSREDAATPVDEVHFDVVAAGRPAGVGDLENVVALEGRLEPAHGLPGEIVGAGVEAARLCGDVLKAHLEGVVGQRRSRRG